MPSTRLHIDALSLSKQVRTLSERMKDEVAKRSAVAASLEFQNEWKILFRSPAEPSIPGAPPRVQTGTYRRDVHMTDPVRRGNAIEVSVGVSLDYPEYLEYGTSRMPPHPIQRPAFDHARGRAINAATAVLKAALPR